MPQRILILSASVGAGHLRAAQAVELALKELAPEAVVQNLDVLQFTNAAFRRLYAQAYLDLANKAPHVLGYFYDLLDHPTSKRRVRDRLRLLLERLNLRPFLRFLSEESWELIINTHFLPAGIIARLRRKLYLHTPHFTVTTDFETHRLWVNEPCEHYFTATEEGAAYLASWGVPEGDISAVGIPIHPAFSRGSERAACLKSCVLSGDRPMVLQLAGGFGMGPIANIFRGILNVEVPLEVVAVTGRNEKARRELAEVAVPARHRAKILGFTDRMDELLAVADVVVSKPGGLTTSEALARGAAMAIVNPIPGQESRNSDYLLENGAAIKINHLATLPHKLSALLRDPARLAELRRNALRIARPRAAFEVARFAVSWPIASGA